MAQQGRSPMLSIDVLHSFIISDCSTQTCNHHIFQILCLITQILGHIRINVTNFTWIYEEAPKIKKRKKQTKFVPK